MKKFTLMVSIFSLSFIGASFTAVAPAMAAFTEAFPTVSASSIQLILTLPLLICVPFILFSGAIASKVSKKKLILLGLLLFTTGGTAAFFLNNFILILFSRGIYGAGFGIIMPFGVGLISDFFFGTKEYQTMLGYQSVVTNFGNILITLVSSFLCSAGWHNVFLVYFIGVVVMLLILLGLPNPPIPKKKAIGRTKTKIPKIVFLYSIGTLIYSIWMSVTNSHISFLIKDANMGNTSTSGIVLTLCTIGGVVGALFFSSIWKVLGRYSTAFGILLNAAGLLTMSFAPNLAVVILGSVSAGFGNGIVMPSMFMIVSSKDRTASTLYFSLIMSALTLGGFFCGVGSPVITSALFGGSGTGKPAFLLGGICQLLTFCVFLLFSQKTS